ncbi:Rieske 2Fe-2S domain-containing protein [Gimesia aquarii]|uniref:Naphthalene 1,2-dioxygenase system ferredoxin subunit n=1 Tax=Gimesia aquarii TaxID=2527964 RepID=A0A517W4T4_9PLAN|nr:Rieske 2Fe-2S domain-containing protein [Gimesia aquarii]QDU00258.1 Naphthalene 1,2-dioxygenase system ferredoxin subunit [Gimesia aquarii]
MTNWIPLGSASEISPGNRKVYALKGTEIAVFHVANKGQPGEFYAIHDCCPHQGASLVEGEGTGTEIACPLHDWTFDVASGECHDFPEFPLTRYELKVENDNILIEASAFEELDIQDHLFLVRYGAMGWIDHFSAEEDAAFSHRDRIILKTSRGEEIGEILSKAINQDNSITPAGSILRMFTPTDQQKLLQQEDITTHVLQDCQSLIQERGMPTEIIDCEQLFDQQTVVLYYLGNRMPALEILAQELNANYAWRIVFHPVDEAPAPSGCSSGGCGCDQK